MQKYILKIKKTVGQKWVMANGIKSRMSPFLVLVFLFVGGCYSTSSVYRTDIDTVCVEMFKSSSFRRGVEFELHRALCQQVELHTPYKIESNRGKADTVIYGKIISVTEDVQSRQRELDRPLENQITLTVQVTWKDLRNKKLLMDSRKFRFSSNYAVLLSAGRTGAMKEATNLTARRIVEAMEQEW